MLDGNKPGQDHGEVEGDAGPPEGAPKDGPVAAQKGESGHDDQGQEGGDGALGEGGYAGKEIDVEEPELGVGLVPGVPAQKADGQRRGHLHIGGDVYKRQTTKQLDTSKFAALQKAI